MAKRMKELSHTSLDDRKLNLSTVVAKNNAGSSEARGVSVANLHSRLIGYCLLIIV